jgi:SAM-dependent methyltransferase
MLDMPCGTGRFRQLLQAEKYEVTHADISQEMLDFARKRSDSQEGATSRCEAEAASFREGVFGSVLSFRFLPHLPEETRKKVLLELARVSQGPLVIDYRFKYAFRTLSRWIRYRLGIAKKLRPRYSLSQISAELSEVGLTVVKWFPVVWLFSEKVVLLCQKQPRAGKQAPARSCPTAVRLTA